MSNKKIKFKKIGTVSHISSTNKIIIPSKQTPKIGLTLVNKQKKPIGRISDIFGSTKKPYISVKTNKKFKKVKPGDEVYLPPRKNNRRRMKVRHS